MRPCVVTLEETHLHSACSARSSSCDRAEVGAHSCVFKVNSSISLRARRLPKRRYAGQSSSASCGRLADETFPNGWQLLQRGIPEISAEIKRIDREPKNSHVTDEK